MLVVDDIVGIALRPRFDDGAGRLSNPPLVADLQLGLFASCVVGSPPVVLKLQALGAEVLEQQLVE